MADPTERSVVKTYVPAYQKEEWCEHADALDMTQSEFVRTMVQAGRRGFGATVEDAGQAEQPSRESAGSPGDGEVVPVRQRVQELLEPGEYRSFEDLRSDLVGDIETDLDDALQDLQAEGTIRYSGRNDGYTQADP